MKVKLTYLVQSSCLNNHSSMARPGKSGVMSHDEAKAFYGTPCDPGILPFFQIVDEKEVMDKLKIMDGLGHKVEVEYLTEEESS